MFGLRVRWKDGKVETFYFADEKSREKKANWFKLQSRVEKVTSFEMKNSQKW